MAEKYCISLQLNKYALHLDGHLPFLAKKQTETIQVPVLQYGEDGFNLIYFNFSLNNYFAY